MCFRPVFEGCFSEEPLPYSDPTGAAGGGNCRLDSPSQESRLQAQRIRGQDSRGHGHTPQNRPHGHQPPDLPEGYGQSHSFEGFNCSLHKLVATSLILFVKSLRSYPWFLLKNRAANNSAGSGVLSSHTDGRQHLARPSDTAVRSHPLLTSVYSKHNLERNKP